MAITVDPAASMLGPHSPTDRKDDVTEKSTGGGSGGTAPVVPADMVGPQYGKKEINVTMKNNVLLGFVFTYDVLFLYACDL